MEPDEFLIHNTIRIETQTSVGLATGTGFFYEFFNDEQNPVPVIVTNKHVIKDAIIGVLRFSLMNNDKKLVNGETYTMTITEFEKAWILHPNPNIDLCILPIAQICHEALKNNKILAYATLTKKDIITQAEIEELSKIEEITVIGYPDGIWDYYNNLPITRRGITATPIHYNFENTPRFLIDAAIYGGSSGSPVFIFNQASYSIKDSLHIGSRIKLIGIVYAVAQHTVSGNFKIVDIPSVKTTISITQIPNNLGVVIKASELFGFEKILRERLEHEISNIN